MNGQLVSTRDKEKKKISYSDALLQGLAPDGGLYTPEFYPQFSQGELASLKDFSYPELTFEVKRNLVGGSIPDAVLSTMTKRAYSPDKFNSPDGNVVPVRKVGPIFIQNLSKGPTASFKDIALQELAEEMNYELAKREQTLDLLGGTSGDTGSSSEKAFKGRAITSADTSRLLEAKSRIRLFMLSPRDRMSAFQRAQMGVLSGGNIHNIAVDGTFDDCQDLVKKLKGESEFSKLGAVNSINWGRVSSQVPYYFSGYLQVAKEVGQPIDFVVPSGNFGNILAGYVARRMGLPIRNLIVATNENNVLDVLFRTGVYQWKKSTETSSPSMDISEASNFERLAFEFFQRNPEKLAEFMKQFKQTKRANFADFGLSAQIFRDNGFYSGSSTHKDRLRTIKGVYDKTAMIIDTHTADGVKVAMDYKREDGVPMIVMETALPVKFENTIKEALGFVPEREERFRGLEGKVRADAFYQIRNDAEELRQYLRQHRN